MFLTGMVLFVGGQLLLLSGKVGVESSGSSESSFFGLSSVVIELKIKHYLYKFPVSRYNTLYVNGTYNS